MQTISALNYLIVLSFLGLSVAKAINTEPTATLTVGHLD